MIERAEFQHSGLNPGEKKNTAGRFSFFIPHLRQQEATPTLLARFSINYSGILRLTLITMCDVNECLVIHLGARKSPVNTAQHTSSPLHNITTTQYHDKIALNR